MNKNIFLLIIVTVIVAGGAGFFAGTKYQQSKSPFAGNFRGMRDRMGQGPANDRRPVGAQTVRGEIIAKDEDKLAVKMPDGSSKIVLVSENTEIGKTTQGLAEDLAEGEPVVVFGQENSDGSLSATNIQIGAGLTMRSEPRVN